MLKHNNYDIFIYYYLFFSKVQPVCKIKIQPKILIDVHVHISMLLYIHISTNNLENKATHSIFSFSFF